IGHLRLGRGPAGAGDHPGVDDPVLVQRLDARVRAPGQPWLTGLRPPSGDGLERWLVVRALFLAQLRHQLRDVPAAVEAVERDPAHGQAIVQAVALAEADGQADTVRAGDFAAVRQAGLLDQLTQR